MQFRIGAFTYRVRRKHNLSMGRDWLQGLCEPDTRTLWLDADLADEVIASVLRHELLHAWIAETSQPVTEEDQANMTATVGAAFDEVFETQGGLPAIHRIPIEGIGGGNKLASAAPPYDRVTCGRCGTEVMSGSIHSDPLKLVAGRLMTRRGFGCPVCDTVNVWDAMAAEDGTVLGGFFNAKLLSASEAAEWQRGHQVHCPYNAA